MELESRKVQKLGYSSLGVSLPKAWAVSNGIRPGSVVNLSIEDDGTLRIRVAPFEEYPTAADATIDADEWMGPESLTRLITGDYIVGCNTIRVRSREEISPGQLQEIHEAVRGLTGLTIVNQGPRFVTIENFVEPPAWRSRWTGCTGSWSDSSSWQPRTGPSPRRWESQSLAICWATGSSP